MTVTKDGRRYVAQSTYVEREIPKAAGFRWDKERKHWYTIDVAVAGKLAQYAAPEVAVELHAAHAARVAALDASRASDADVDAPAPEGCEYLPFQRAGIAYALARSATLIGDEMGCGKTVQAIGVINADESIQRVLVVCPATIRLNWQRELEKWSVRPLTVGIASTTDWPQTDVTIVNWDICDRLRDRLRTETWDLVVLDECHRAKSQTAKRTLATVGAEAYKQRPADDGIVARRKLALTGTPILNRPIELFPVLHWLDPVAWPRLWSYARRYCNAHQTKYGWDLTGASNLSELQEKLRVGLMVRRLKSEVLRELPVKRRQVVVLPTNGATAVVEAESAAWAAHEQRIESLRADAELAKAEDDETYTAAVARLRDATRVAFTEMARLRHDTAVAKVPAVVAHVIDALEGGSEKVAVWAHHHDVVDAVRDGLAEYEPVVLTGDTPMADRQAAVDRFQADPTCRVFIGSITAAGVGLTLTASSHAVFAELDWVPGNVTQAEDRHHRIGQRNSVLIQHVVLDGSLDARMAQTLVAKQDIADRLLDRDPDPLPALPQAGTSETTPRGRVAKLAERITDEGVTTIHAALRRIAGMCDGARVLDGAGFNKIDARVGHELAARPSLTARQSALGALIARKYSRQLGQDMTAALDAAVGKGDAP